MKHRIWIAIVAATAIVTCCAFVASSGESPALAANISSQDAFVQQAGSADASAPADGAQSTPALAAQTAEKVPSASATVATSPTQSATRAAAPSAETQESPAATQSASAQPELSASAPEDPYAPRRHGTDFEVLREGSSGERVDLLHRFLVGLGYLDAPDDPLTFTAKTHDAVRAFQERNNLVADGIVGNSTWDVLLMSNARACA